MTSTIQDIAAQMGMDSAQTGSAGVGSAATPQSSKKPFGVVDIAAQMGVDIPKSSTSGSLPAGVSDFSKKEAKYGLPAGILSDIRDRGERSGSTAKSPAGALGRFQLMPEVAKYYQVDPTNDDQAAEAAAKLLRDLYSEYRKKYPGLGEKELRDVVVSHYNGGYSAGNAVANGKQPPAKETRNYLSRVNGPDDLTELANSLGVVAPGTKKEKGVSTPVLPQANYDETARLAKRPVVGVASTGKAQSGPQSGPQSGVSGRVLSGTGAKIDPYTLLPLTNEQVASGAESAATHYNREEPGWFEPGSKSEAFVQGVSSGSSLGLGPLVAPWLRKNVFGNEEPLEDLRRQQADIRDRSWNRNPGITLAGELAGGLILPVGAAKTGATLTAKALRGASVGAGQGAVSGAANQALDPESSGADIVRSGAVGASLGGAIGGGAPVLGALGRATGKAADKYATNSRLGKRALEKLGDNNPVTGGKIQSSVSELLGDLSGASSLTEAGRTRLVNAQLAKEYEKSSPRLVTKDRVWDDNTSRWINVDRVEPRYDKDGRRIFDNKYREVVGKDTAGRDMYGPPVMDESLIPHSRLGREITDSKGKVVGYEDNAIELPDVMPSEVPAVWGPVSDDISTPLPTEYGLINGGAFPEHGVHPLVVEQKLGGKPYKISTPDPLVERVAKHNMAEELSKEFVSAGHVDFTPDFVKKHGFVELAIKDNPDRYAALLKSARADEQKKLDELFSKLDKMDPKAASAVLATKYQQEFKRIAIERGIDVAMAIGAYWAESTGLPTAARDLFLAGLALHHGKPFVKDMGKLAAEVVPDYFRAYNLRMAAGDAAGARSMATRIGDKMMTAALNTGRVAAKVTTSPGTALRGGRAYQSEQSSNTGLGRIPPESKTLATIDLRGGPVPRTIFDGRELLGGQREDSYESLR